MFRQGESGQEEEESDRARIQGAPQERKTGEGQATTTGGKGAPSGKAAASGSNADSSRTSEINALYAQTLSDIAKKRGAKPMVEAASFVALQKACEQEVLHPREKGFAGSALAPQLPLFYKNFLDPAIHK